MSETAATTQEYGAPVRRADVRPPLRISRLVLALVVSAVSIYLAAGILPGFSVGVLLGRPARRDRHRAAQRRALAHHRRLQILHTLVSSFLLLLVLERARAPGRRRAHGERVVVDNFGWALLAALVISAITTALSVIAGTNDDDAYTIRVIQRIARRSGERVETDAPGILYLEIDGLAKVSSARCGDGNAPTMARWLGNTQVPRVGDRPLVADRREPGRDPARVERGHPAFRWVEKERGIMMTCSAPDDCAEIERRHAGHGLSATAAPAAATCLGEADHVILTVSRIEAEKSSNPGYRAFFANGTTSRARSSSSRR